jgi:hypothetical protein
MNVSRYTNAPGPGCSTSFGVYGLALVHGVTAGTDTSLPVVHCVYVGSAAAVAALLTYRIGLVRSRPGRPQVRLPHSRRHPAHES